MAVSVGFRQNGMGTEPIKMNYRLNDTKIEYRKKLNRIIKQNIAKNITKLLVTFQNKKLRM